MHLDTKFINIVFPHSTTLFPTQYTKHQLNVVAMFPENWFGFRLLNPMRELWLFTYSVCKFNITQEWFFKKNISTGKLKV